MLIMIFAQLLPFETTVNPGYLFVLLAVIMLIIGLRLYNAWKESNAPHEKKKTAATHDTRLTQAKMFPNRSVQGPDKSDLKYVLKTYGFTREQGDFFARLCRGRKIENPSRLLQDEKAFADFCTQVLNYLQAQHVPVQEIEKNKTLLFTLRETVENYRQSARFIASTRSIKPGQQFTLTTAKEEHYPSSVLANKPEGLICAVPLDLAGKELKLPLFSRVDLFFYSGTGESYQLSSKIRQYETSPNITRMVIGHTDSIRMLPNRNHARKTLTIICLFCPVTVANVVNGKHTEHKFFPSGKNYEGTILDISAGGCSIKTGAPAAVGDYIQIKCVLDGKNDDTMIAKVVKQHVIEGDRKMVMHMQFAKIPRATMNRIFSFIYNYGDSSK